MTCRFKTACASETIPPGSGSPQASRSRHCRAGRPILSPLIPAAPSPGIRILPGSRFGARCRVGIRNVSSPHRGRPSAPRPHRRHRGRHQEYPLAGTRKDEIDTALGYFEGTRPACATTGSAGVACSSAPASSRPAARQSSGKDSSSPACTGPSTTPTPTSPSAAKKPAAPGKPSATTRTLRHAPPDQRARQTTRQSPQIDAHPRGAAGSRTNASRAPLAHLSHHGNAPPSRANQNSTDKRHTRHLLLSAPLRACTGRQGSEIPSSACR